jgi:primase-polymerase (primpol)-like protein
VTDGKLRERVERSLPAEMQGERRFVVWRAEPSEATGKPTKVPYVASKSRTERKASSTNSGTWRTLEAALDCYESSGRWDGIGYMLHGSGRVGLDLDDCIRDGLLHPEARAVAELFPEGYWEVSPSGKGIKGVVPGRRTWRRVETTATDWGGELGMYGEDENRKGARYFAITGEALT